MPDDARKSVIKKDASLVIVPVWEPWWPWFDVKMSSAQENFTVFSTKFENRECSSKTSYSWLLISDNWFIRSDNLLAPYFEIPKRMMIIICYYVNHGEQCPTRSSSYYPVNLKQITIINLAIWRNHDVLEINRILIYITNFIKLQSQITNHVYYLGSINLRTCTRTKHELWFCKLHHSEFVNRIDECSQYSYSSIYLRL